MNVCKSFGGREAAEARTRPKAGIKKKMFLQSAHLSHGILVHFEGAQELGGAVIDVQGLEQVGVSVGEEGEHAGV